ncbi:MAG: DHHW family protein [Ruminococcus sp.]|nr:DHHW family protein [Ruminococcus sp.]
MQNNDKFKKGPEVPQFFSNKPLPLPKREKVIENPKNLDGGFSNLRKKIPLITKLYMVSAALFAFTLFVMGFISIADKDKTVSKAENRALAKRPEFSFAALKDGSYTVDFENYYSDNFPARDFFIKVNRKIGEVLTQFSAGDDGEVIVSVERKDEDFAGEGVDLGQKTTQATTESATQGMKDNTADVTPDNEATVRGSIIISGNRAMEIYSYSESSVKNYANIINSAAKAMPAGTKFYSLIAPTAVEFYGTKTYRTGVHSQRDAIKNAYSMLDDSIIKVDAYSSLVDKSKEYIYFRTDHHWTARGAYYAYSAFCDAAGATAPAITDFKTHNIDGFVGSLYRSSQASVLKKDPDYVECFELLVDATNMVYSSQAMTDGTKTYIVANKVSGDNKYLAFISGDQPIEKITTSVKNGKKILVLKESFGNAFVPFLCNNYEEVYVVDPRKIDMNLPEFVKTNGIQEVLAINYSFGLSNKTYCSALNNLIK